MADDKLSRTTLYNEHLTPPDNVAEVPDTAAGHLSGQILVDSKSGWHWAPEPPEPTPGRAPEPVTYAPVEPQPEPEFEPEPAPKAKTKTRAADADKPEEGSD